MSAPFHNIGLLVSVCKEAMQEAGERKPLPAWYAKMKGVLLMFEPNPKQKPSDGWQPIEAAPKDGKKFLGYFGSGEMHVVFIKGDECFRPLDDQLLAIPEFWMPLPVSPGDKP